MNENPFRPLARHCSAAAWVAGLLLLAAGCRSGHLYQASSLPPELIAPTVDSVQNLDLTRLARSGGDSELLYAGDLVQITITTGVEETAPEGWDLRVAENGMVDVPLVGAVQLAGLRLPEAEYAIRSESIRRGKFVNPNVSVRLVQRRSNRVTVVGAVKSPGTYDVPAAQSDLLTALVMAGNLSPNAGTLIEIKHPQHVSMAAGPLQFTSHGRPMPAVPQTVRIDLKEAVTGPTPNLQLFDGSTVMVMQKPKRFIHVMGLVNKADQFEMPDDVEVRLLDAIAMAGGAKLEVCDKVHVIRAAEDGSEPVVIEASIRDAKRDGVSNIRLAAGDVVSVEETPTTFVVGTIRDFVRFGFSSAIPGF